MTESPDSWQADYAFADDYFEHGGLRMHYVDQGEGAPLLLVHGNPTWSFYYRALIRHFSGRYRAVAPDHIGCGWSDKPQDYAYTLRQHAANLEALVTALDLQQITLVVHDWGGAIGLLAAMAAPQRYRNLVLLNTAAFPPPYIPWRIRACRLPGCGTWGVRGANLFARAAQYMAVQRRASMTDAARAGLIAPYGDWQSRVAIDGFVRDIPASPRHPTWQVLSQLESQLGRLSHCRVLLVWGMRDWCFRPACLARLETLFPQHQTVRLHDVGHWVLEEASEQVVQAMDEFLTRPAAAPGSTQPIGES